jgi:hypothetical protein
MSIGGFNGIHEKLLAMLAQRKPGEREGGRA